MSGLNRIKAGSTYFEPFTARRSTWYHSLCTEISKYSSSNIHQNLLKIRILTDTADNTFFTIQTLIWAIHALFLLFSSFPFLTDPYGVGFERRHLITVIRALARTSFCQTTIVRILMHIQQKIHFKESENTLDGISEKIHPFW